MIEKKIDNRSLKSKYQFQDNFSDDSDIFNKLKHKKKKHKKVTNVYNTVSELYNDLLEIYFDEYNELLDAKRKE